MKISFNLILVIFALFILPLLVIMILYIKEIINTMEEEEQELDIYFQGSKEELFAMLFPLTGPESPIFDHLDLNKIQYRSVEKGLQFTYNTKDFSNIDKQQEEIVYESTALPTHSNYFYSTTLPEKKAMVWRSVTRMIEMRPGKVGAPSPIPPKTTQ